jgi:KRAB domain-containing zinc finger protein
MDKSYPTKRIRPRMKKYDPMKYYKCYICHSPDFIRTDLNIKPDSKTYDTPKYDTKEEFLLHCQTEEHKQNKKRLTCEICNQEQMSDELLEKHMKEEHKQKPTCKTCGKTFKFPSLLKKHQRTHEPKEQQPKQTYQCCGKTFNFKSDYDRHLQTNKHTKPKQVLTCCGYTFKYQSEYNRHLLTKKHSQQVSND